MKHKITPAILLLILFISSCSTKKEDKQELFNYLKNNELPKLKAVLQTIENKTAFLNQQDSLGNTWLHYAVNLNNHQIAALFLINGADPNIANSEQLTPLDLARKNKFSETTLKIHEFQLQDWKLQEEKFSAENLEYAILNDNTLIIKEFISSNIVIDSMLLSNDFSPLVTAIFANSDNASLFLIENGANPNDQFDTRSVLAMAVMFNQPKVVKLLLEKGADVNATDGTLITPLMFAVQEGFTEIVDILLQHNADITLKDRDGETAHDKAIKANNNEIAKKLVVQK